MIATAERVCLALTVCESRGEGFLRFRKGDLIWAMGAANSGYIRAVNMLTLEPGLVPPDALPDPLFCESRLGALEGTALRR